MNVLAFHVSGCVGVVRLTVKIEMIDKLRVIGLLFTQRSCKSFDLINVLKLNQSGEKSCSPEEIPLHGKMSRHRTHQHTHKQSHTHTHLTHKLNSGRSLPPPMLGIQLQLLIMK